MEAFYRQADDVSPEINFDPANQPFVIEGRSLVENVHHFYEPLMSWLRGLPPRACINDPVGF